MIAKGKSPITYDHKTRVSRETGRCPLAHGAERALTRVARQNLPTCNYAHTDPSRDCDMLVPHQSMQLHWPCYNQSRRVMPYSLPSRHTSPPPRQRAPDVWDLGHAQTATPGAATNASTTCTRTPLQATRFVTGGPPLGHAGRRQGRTAGRLARASRPPRERRHQTS